MDLREIAEQFCPIKVKRGVVTIDFTLYPSLVQSYITGETVPFPKQIFGVAIIV